MARNLNDNYAIEDRWRAVVEHGAGTLVVNAGPGTGKTFSLLRKIEALLADGVTPGKIYYLTFVNSIVEAFSADVEKPREEGGLGATVDELGFRVSTLHSLAFKVLRTYHAQLGIPEEAYLLNLSPRSKTLPSLVMLGDLVSLVGAEIGGRNNVKRAIESLVMSWQCGQTPPKELGDFPRVVETLAGAYHALSWDQSVPMANHAIRRYGIPSWLADASHFLVDEYQDFNPPEQEFIELVSEPSDSVVVVGDVDQSIYGGRGASPSGLQALLQRDDVYTVNFVRCRRCPVNVIEGANRILQLIDPGGWEQRQLQPHKEDAGGLVVEEKRSCKAEVDDIARFVSAWNERGDRVIVLLPSTKALIFYRKQLLEAGIPSEGDAAESSALERVILELVAGAAPPFFERLLLSVYKPLERRFGKDILPSVMDGRSIRDSLRAASECARWRQDVREAFTQFMSDLEQLRSRDIETILDVSQRLGVTLEPDVLKYILEEPDDASPRERVVRALAGTNETDGAQNPVRLLTMHSSKGLSVPIVIIPACEDKWIPGNVIDERLEEQKRLFYVALTRAEKGVLITSPRTRAKGDPLNYAVPGTEDGLSRFAASLR